MAIQTIQIQFSCFSQLSKPRRLLPSRLCLPFPPSLSICMQRRWLCFYSHQHSLLAVPPAATLHSLKQTPSFLVPSLATTWTFNEGVVQTTLPMLMIPRRQVLVGASKRSEHYLASHTHRKFDFADALNVSRRRKFQVLKSLKIPEAPSLPGQGGEEPLSSFSPSTTAPQTLCSAIYETQELSCT